MLDTLATSADDAPTAPQLAAFDGVDEPGAVIALAVQTFRGGLGVLSSFGADAAVLLHMVAAVDPALPVVFIDTGRHFPETLRYRDALVARLGLTNLVAVGPGADEVERLDPRGERFSYDPDGCCAFRKVAPLARALSGFRAVISGRKRHQAATRAMLKTAELVDGKAQISPLASWTAQRIEAYRVAQDLPAHPLAAEGYPSIGCAPCTSRVGPGEDPRAGRWRGFDKVECGIHRPAAGAVTLKDQTI